MNFILEIDGSFSQAQIDATDYKSLLKRFVIVYFVLFVYFWLKRCIWYNSMFNNVVVLSPAE